MSPNFSSALNSSLMKLRDKKPLIHNITNHVVSNFAANTLLSVGASPLMAHDERELEEIISISNALLINIGTLDEGQVEAMEIAIRSANQRSIPIVIDPVGAGASILRTKTSQKLIALAKNPTVKANASEIMAIADYGIESKGVDSNNTTQQALEAGKYIIKSLEAENVVITGVEDLILNKSEIYKCSHGHKLMADVTGMGCVLGSVIAAFLSIQDEILSLHKIGHAISYFNIAAERAAKLSLGPGSFVPSFLDNLHNWNIEEIQENIGVTKC